MKLLGTLLALVLSLNVYAQPETPKVIVLDAAITGASIRPASQYLEQLLAQPVVPSKIQLVINSPGGSVVAGFLFLDRLTALKQRGTAVECYVAEVAASMAFQILLQCDSRYVLDTSFLLWHRARVFIGGFGGTALTGPDAYALGIQLKDLDRHIYRDVRKYMNAPDHYIRFHFERETLHTGSNLAKSVPSFIQITEDTSWVMARLSDTEALHMAKVGFFDSITFGELIYIWDRVLTVDRTK